MGLTQKITILALPVVFSNITLPLQGLIDVAIMGHLEDANYLSAVGLCTQLFALLLVSFNFLQYANSGLSAQAKGVNDYKELQLIFNRGLIVAVGIGVMIFLLQIFWFDLSLLFFKPSPEISELMRDYYNIRIWGAPIELSIYVSIGWFAGTGKTKILFYQQLLISISNVILNLIFVLVLKLDVAGVALGTVIANILGFIYALFMVNNQLNQHDVDLFKTSLKAIFNWIAIRRLISLNRDILIRTVILVFAFAWIMRLSTSQGEVILAANIVLMQLIYISAYGLDGIAVAAESLVGQAYGKKDIAQVKKIVNLSLIVSIVLAILFIVIFIVIKPIFITQMTNIAIVQSTVSQYFYYAVLTVLVAVFAYLYDGVMFGLTENQAIRNSMMIVGAIFFPLSYLIVMVFDNYGVWLAIYLFFTLRAICLFYFYRKFLLRNI